MSKPLTRAAREILEAEIKRADKRKIKELRAEIESKDKLIEQLKLALKSAEQFIENGVEYGYITMPDPETPDKAHKMLPEIKAALSAAERITK